MLLLRNPFYKSLPAITPKFTFRKDVHLLSYVFQSLQPHSVLPVKSEVDVFFKATFNKLFLRSLLYIVDVVVWFCFFGFF